jgi:hypothetical protein
MLKKFADLLYDATVGVVKDYQRKTVELVKITAATYYVQGIRALRRYFVTVFLAVFFTLTLVVTVVVIPVALVMVAPLGAGVKMLSVCLLGLIYVGVSWYFISNLLSEKRWLRFSGSDEFIDKVAGKNGFKP